MGAEGIIKESIYREMYDKISKGINLEEYSVFPSRYGKSYKNQDIKFMTIGRCTNGWGKDDQNINSSESLIRVAKHEVNDQYVHYASNSSFWRTNKRIWERLCGFNENSKTKEDFVSSIAWGNLYKIAPKQDANPSNLLCALQHDFCNELLDLEIDDFCPTHLLLVTGQNWLEWDYKKKHYRFDILDKVADYKDSKHIIKAGRITIKSGGSTKVVITNRPEGKPEDDYVDAVLQAFKEII